MINYYRDMWIRRSELMTPLTRLTSKIATWNWTEVEQKAFNDIKTVISQETLLTYPDFDNIFDVHTDASEKQLGAVLSQNGKPIAFYSRKLNPAQTRYTTTERELLAIVETLKEFRNILLGQRLRVHTDHKNLTFKHFNTDRVMRWRLVLEEFGPELVYVRGEKNVVADALSRLALSDNVHPSQESLLADLFADDSLPDDVFPLRYQLIAEQQQRDDALQAKLKSDKDFATKIFHGGGRDDGLELITKDGKIVMPATLQDRCIRWYHSILCHPGEARTEQTIRQHFYWKGLRRQVQNVCQRCRTCQLTKRKTIKYGELPPKEAEIKPWEVLCVDLIGPYKINQPKRKGKKKDLELFCLTMIDPATGWFEMVRIPNKEAITVANLAEQTWLTRYPWPQRIIFDKGTELSLIHI